MPPSPPPARMRGPGNGGERPRAGCDDRRVTAQAGARDVEIDRLLRPRRDRSPADKKLRWSGAARALRIVKRSLVSDPELALAAGDPGGIGVAVASGSGPIAFGRRAPESRLYSAAGAPMRVIPGGATPSVSPPSGRSPGRRTGSATNGAQPGDRRSRRRHRRGSRDLGLLRACPSGRSAPVVAGIAAAGDRVAAAILDEAAISLAARQAAPLAVGRLAPFRPRSQVDRVRHHQVRDGILHQLAGVGFFEPGCVVEEPVSEPRACS